MISTTPHVRAVTKRLKNQQQFILWTSRNSWTSFETQSSRSGWIDLQNCLPTAAAEEMFSCSSYPGTTYPCRVAALLRLPSTMECCNRACLKEYWMQTILVGTAFRIWSLIRYDKHNGNVLFLSPEIWLDFGDPDRHRMNKQQAYLVMISICSSSLINAYLGVSMITPTTQTTQCRFNRESSYSKPR